MAHRPTHLRLITAVEAARRLCVTRQRVNAMLSEGLLEGVIVTPRKRAIKGDLYVIEESLAAMLEREELLRAARKPTGIGKECGA